MSSVTTIFDEASPFMTETNKIRLIHLLKHQYCEKNDNIATSKINENCI